MGFAEKTSWIAHSYIHVHVHVYQLLHLYTVQWHRVFKQLLKKTFADIHKFKKVFSFESFLLYSTIEMPSHMSGTHPDEVAWCEVELGVLGTVVGGNHLGDDGLTKNSDSLTGARVRGGRGCGRRSAL